jgi:repressor LexA
MNEPLVPRNHSHRHTLEVIRELIAAHGYSPTVRELCDALALASTSTVYERLRALKRQGWITYERNSPRTIRVCNPGDEAA